VTRPRSSWVSPAPGPEPRRSRSGPPAPPPVTAAVSVTVRVDLVGAKPPVWRRLELPSTLRLDELHGVLQAVFGWTDSHLHRFSLGDSAFDDQVERFLCPYDVEEGEDASPGLRGAARRGADTAGRPTSLHLRLRR
jgi:hypothetical protein